MAIHGTLKSVVVSADGAALTGKGYFYGCVLSGTAGVCKFYDNTAASGTQIFEASALGSYIFDTPIPVNAGIFVDLTSAVVTVLYQAGP